MIMATKSYSSTFHYNRLKKKILTDEFAIQKANSSFKRGSERENIREPCFEAFNWLWIRKLILVPGQSSNLRVILY